jgi:predicted 2-oxoglutarate/Fe(II)-dependent dioxygenase YbiX
MKNLENFVKVYNFLDKKFCNKIRLELNKTANWEKHKFYNSATGVYDAVSGERELDMSYGNLPILLKDNLMQKVWECIKTYIVDDFNKPYFSSWNGFNDIRFNRYKKNKLMALHVDHIHSMFDGNRKGIPILSVVGLLNDDFSGGKFLMYDEEIDLKLKQGDILIFPSSFLYPHKVTPVTKGIRDSFVTWVF